MVCLANERFIAISIDKVGYFNKSQNSSVEMNVDSEDPEETTQKLEPILDPAPLAQCGLPHTLGDFEMSAAHTALDSFQAI